MNSASIFRTATAWGVLVAISSQVIGQSATSRFELPLEAGITDSIGVDEAGFSPLGASFYAMRHAPQGGDNRLFVWDAKSGSPLWDAHFENYDGLRDVAWSDDDGLVAVLGVEPRFGSTPIWLLDGTTGAQHKRIEFAAGDDYVRQIEFAPSGQRILVSTGESDRARRFHVLHAETGESLAVIETLPRQCDMAVAPAGTQVAIVGADSDGAGILQIWDWETGEVVGKTRKQSGTVLWVEYLPGGGKLVTMSSDGQLKIWDVSNPQAPKVLHSRQYRGVGTDSRLAVNSQGKYIAYSDGDFHDPRAFVLDVKGNELATLAGRHVDGGILPSPDGSAVVSYSNDRRQMPVWLLADLAVSSPQVVMEAPLTNTDPDSVPDVVEFTSDNRQLMIASSYEEQAAVVEVNTRRYVIPQSDEIRCLITPPGEMLCREYAGAKINFRLKSTGTPVSRDFSAVLQALGGGEFYLTSNAYASYSPKHQHYVVWVAPGPAAICDVQGRELARVSPDPDGTDQCLFTADGEYLVTLGEEHDLVILHDPRSGAEIDRVRVPEAECSHYMYRHRILAGSSNGKYLFARSNANESAIWRLDLQSGEVDYPFTIHDLQSRVGCSGFTVCRTKPLVVIAGQDGRIRVCDSDGGDLVAMWEAPHYIRGIGISADGQFVAATLDPSNDNYLRVVPERDEDEKTPPSIMIWKVPQSRNTAPSTAVN